MAGPDVPPVSGAGAPGSSSGGGVGVGEPAKGGPDGVPGLATPRTSWEQAARSRTADTAAAARRAPIGASSGGSAGT